MCKIIRARRLTASTAAMFVLQASCSTGGLQPLADAELEIRVVRGPINPVEREGEANVVPVPGAQVVIRELQGRLVARVEAGDDGTVMVSVRSGEYMLEVSRCPMGTMFAKNEVVRVGPVERARATLTCDTGIR